MFNSFWQFNFTNLILDQHSIIFFFLFFFHFISPDLHWFVSHFPVFFWRYKHAVIPASPVDKHFQLQRAAGVTHLLNVLNNYSKENIHTWSNPPKKRGKKILIDQSFTSISKWFIETGCKNDPYVKMCENSQ